MWGVAKRKWLRDKGLRSEDEILGDWKVLERVPTPWNTLEQPWQKKPGWANHTGLLLSRSLRNLLQRSMQHCLNAVGCTMPRIKTQLEIIEKAILRCLVQLEAEGYASPLRIELESVPEFRDLMREAGQIVRKADGAEDEKSEKQGRNHLSVSQLAAEWQESILRQDAPERRKNPVLDAIAMEREAALQRLIATTEPQSLSEVRSILATLPSLYEEVTSQLDQTDEKTVSTAKAIEIGILSSLRLLDSYGIQSPIPWCPPKPDLHSMQPVEELRQPRQTSQ